MKKMYMENKIHNHMNSHRLLSCIFVIWVSIQTAVLNFCHLHFSNAGWQLIQSEKAACSLIPPIQTRVQFWHTLRVLYDNKQWWYMFLELGVGVFSCMHRTVSHWLRKLGGNQPVGKKRRFSTVKLQPSPSYLQQEMTGYQKLSSKTSIPLIETDWK